MVALLSHSDLHANQTASERIDAIFDRMNDRAPAFIAANMTTTDLQELLAEILDSVSDVVSDLQTECDDFQDAAQSAMTALELAELNHQDAQSFGWPDRDETAWTLVWQAMGHVETLIPVPA